MTCANFKTGALSHSTTLPVRVAYNRIMAAQNRNLAQAKSRRPHQDAAAALVHLQIGDRATLSPYNRLI
jgi:hypothetical protein